MQRFAEYLQLQDFRLRTMQGYYRHIGLIATHYACDPQELSEEQLRAYYVHVRCQTPCPCATGAEERSLFQ